MGGDSLIGALQSQRRAGGFAVGHWLYPESAPRVEPHGHDCAHLVLITGGWFESEASGPEMPSAIIFNPAGTFHNDHFHGPGAFVGITLSTELSAIVHELNLPTRPTLLATDAACGLAAMVMRAAQQQADIDQLEALCFELVAEAEVDGLPESRPPRWLTEAADALRDCGGESGVEAVARMVGIHPVHLTRTFRRHFRCTPGDFRRTYRSVKAANLLTCRQTASIAAIAAECGYADQSHLVRSFRRDFGMTPQQFRIALC